MDAALLDTDILNEVLKQKNVQVLQHASAYLGQHGQFAVSSITRYEVVRGLKEKHATKQLTRFTTFCQHSLILPTSDAILDRAADLWVAARRGGRQADHRLTAILHGWCRPMWQPRRCTRIGTCRVAPWTHCAALEPRGVAARAATPI